MSPKTQAVVDAFYAAHGPCCAGCDWWRFYNSVAGECIRSAPTAGPERVAMLGIHNPSLIPGAGHVMMPRDHLCGEFRDSAGTGAGDATANAGVEPRR